MKDLEYITLPSEGEPCKLVPLATHEISDAIHDTLFGMGESLYQVGDDRVALNSQLRTVEFLDNSGSIIQLTELEMRIFRLLLTYPDKSFSSTSMSDIFQYPADSIRVTTFRLRKKLGKYGELIDSSSSFGYKLLANTRNQGDAEGELSYFSDEGVLYFRGERYEIRQRLMFFLGILIKKEGTYMTYEALEFLLDCTRGNLKAHKSYTNKALGPDSPLKIESLWGKGYYVDIKLTPREKQGLQALEDSLMFQDPENHLYSIDKMMSFVEESPICMNERFADLAIHPEIYSIDGTHFTPDEFYILCALFLSYKKPITLDEILKTYFRSTEHLQVDKIAFRLQRKLVPLRMTLRSSEKGFTLMLLRK